MNNLIYDNVLNKGLQWLKNYGVVFYTIILFLYTSFFHQYVFNYETDNYDYYIFSFLVSILALIHFKITKETQIIGFLGVLANVIVLVTGNEILINLSGIFSCYIVYSFQPCVIKSRLVYYLGTIGIINIVIFFIALLFFSHKKIPFSNSGVQAQYLILLIPFIHYFLKKRQVKWLIYMFYMAGVVIVMILESRTALLMLIISIFLLEVKLDRFKRLRAISIFALGIITLILIFLFKEGSSSGRFLIYEVALKNVNLNNIFFGVGLGNLEYIYPSWQANFFKHREIFDDRFIRAGETYVMFNEYLHSVLSVGIFVAVFFFWFLFKGLSFSDDYSKGVKKYCSIFVVIILTSCLFHYPLHIIPIMLLLAVTVGELAQPGYRLLTIKLKTNVYVFAITLWIFYSFFKYFIIHVGGNAINSQIAKVLFHDDKIVIENSYKLELPQKIKRLEAYQKHTKSSLDSLGNYYVQDLDFGNAIKTYEFLSEFIPNSFAYKIQLLNSYKGQHKTKEADSVARTIIKMPAKVPSVEVDVYKQIASEYLNK